MAYYLRCFVQVLGILAWSQVTQAAEELCPAQCILPGIRHYFPRCSGDHRSMGDQTGPPLSIFGIVPCATGAGGCQPDEKTRREDPSSGESAQDKAPVLEQVCLRYATELQERTRKASAALPEIRGGTARSSCPTTVGPQAAECFHAAAPAVQYGTGRWLELCDWRRGDGSCPPESAPRTWTVSGCSTECWWPSCRRRRSSAYDGCRCSFLVRPGTGYATSQAELWSPCNTPIRTGGSKGPLHFLTSFDFAHRRWNGPPAGGKGRHQRPPLAPLSQWTTPLSSSPTSSIAGSSPQKHQGSFKVPQSSYRPKEKYLGRQTSGTTTEGVGGPASGAPHASPTGGRCHPCGQWRWTRRYTGSGHPRGRRRTGRSGSFRFRWRTQDYGVSSSCRLRIEKVSRALCKHLEEPSFAKWPLWLGMPHALCLGQHSLGFASLSHVLSFAKSLPAMRFAMYSCIYTSVCPSCSPRGSYKMDAPLGSWSAILFPYSPSRRQKSPLVLVTFCHSSYFKQQPQPFGHAAHMIPVCTASLSVAIPVFSWEPWCVQKSRIGCSGPATTLTPDALWGVNMHSTLEHCPFWSPHRCCCWNCDTLVRVAPFFIFRAGPQLPCMAILPALSPVISLLLPTSDSDSTRWHALYVTFASRTSAPCFWGIAFHLIPEMPFLCIYPVAYVCSSCARNTCIGRSGTWARSLHKLSYGHSSLNAKKVEEIDLPTGLLLLLASHLVPLAAGFLGLSLLGLGRLLFCSLPGRRTSLGRFIQVMTSGAPQRVFRVLSVYSPACCEALAKTQATAAKVPKVARSNTRRPGLLLHSSVFGFILRALSLPVLVRGGSDDAAILPAAGRASKWFLERSCCV